MARRRGSSSTRASSRASCTSSSTPRPSRASSASASPPSAPRSPSFPTRPPTPPAPPTPPFTHVAGGGKGSFNPRFAQTPRHPSQHEDQLYPADFFPFATVAERDPV